MVQAMSSNMNGMQRKPMSRSSMHCLYHGLILIHTLRRLTTSRHLPHAFMRIVILNPLTIIEKNRADTFGGYGKRVLHLRR